MIAVNANRKMLALLGLSALLILAVIGLRIGEGASGALEKSGVRHGTRIDAAPLKAAGWSSARESIRVQHVVEVAVTTVAGAPVPGAQVVIRAGDEWSKVVATCVTDPLGRAMCLVSDWQEYLVAAQHADFGAAEAVALPGVVELQLCGKCELTARVFAQESRAAVSGVDIRITGPNGIERVQSTDGGGTLGFVGLVPGGYSAEVNAQGFVDYQLPDITVGAGTTHIDIPLFLGLVVSGVALEGDSSHPIAAGQVEAFLAARSV